LLVLFLGDNDKESALFNLFPQKLYDLFNSIFSSFNIFNELSNDLIVVEAVFKESPFFLLEELLSNYYLAYRLLLILFKLVKVLFS